MSKKREYLDKNYKIIQRCWLCMQSKKKVKYLRFTLTKVKIETRSYCKLDLDYDNYEELYKINYKKWCEAMLWLEILSMKNSY